MPFPHQEPQPFTVSYVQSLRPGQMGCYGLFSSAGCVYVGKGDIRERLLAHLRGNNPLIQFFNPSYWLGACTDDFDNLEKHLIREFNPAANLRIG